VKKNLKNYAKYLIKKINYNKIKSDIFKQLFFCKYYIMGDIDEVGYNTSRVGLYRM
jgi:hypothetical protein